MSVSPVGVTRRGCLDALRADARLQIGHVAHLPAWIVRIRMQILDGQILYGDAHDSSLEFRFGFRLPKSPNDDDSPVASPTGQTAATRHRQRWLRPYNPPAWKPDSHTLQPYPSAPWTPAPSHTARKGRSHPPAIPWKNASDAARPPTNAASACPARSHACPWRGNGRNARPDHPTPCSGGTTRPRRSTDSTACRTCGEWTRS